MAPKKSLIFLAGSMLSAGALIVSMGQSASTTSYGKVLANTPAMLITEGQESVFVTLPSQKQANQLSDLIGQNPEIAQDKNAYRKVYSAKIVGVNKQKQENVKAMTRHEVRFQDGATGEAYQLDLLSFQGEKGKQFIGEPGSATPKLQRHPKDSSQFLFEKNFSFYLFDAKTMKVKEVGDHKAKKAAIDKKHTLEATAHGDHEHARVLYWAKEPVWSPSGDQIAFVSNRTHFDTDKPGIETLWLHDVATGNETQIYGDDLAAVRPHGWTQSGQVIITEYRWSNNQSDATIATVDPSTKKVRTLAKGDFVALSDDANTLLYTRQLGNGDAELYALSIETGISTLLHKATGGEVFRSYLADFSADGTRIVTDLQAADGEQTLLVYNLATHEAKRLALPQGQQLAGDVQWSGSELVVPLENLKELTSETLLMSVE
jgi:hypothetical protein